MRTTQVRAKLSARINALNARYAAEMRRRMVPTPKAIKLKEEIEQLQREVEAIDRDAAQRLALEKAPIDEVLEVIAIPLLADVMNDIVAGVDGTLRRNGCQETVFSDYTRQIRHAALAMVDTLEHGDDNLPKLLEVDDTLVDAVKKKIMSFIKQRLNITE